MDQKVEDEASLDEAESSPVVRYVNHIIQTALKEGRVRHPHRARGQVPQGAVPDRRRPVRDDEPATRGMHAVPHVAHQDHGEPGHRRAPPAAGRPHPRDGRWAGRSTFVSRRSRRRRARRPSCVSSTTGAINVPLDEARLRGRHADDLGRTRSPSRTASSSSPARPGSGKTTTLYASIQQMDLRRLNVSTVEDPVEYNLERHHADADAREDRPVVLLLPACPAASGTPT